MSWVGENERRHRRASLQTRGPERQNIHYTYTTYIHFSYSQIPPPVQCIEIIVVFPPSHRSALLSYSRMIFSHVHIFYTWNRRNLYRRVSFMYFVCRRVYMILLPAYLLGRLVGGSRNLLTKYITLPPMNARFIILWYI